MKGLALFFIVFQSFIFAQKDTMKSYDVKIKIEYLDTIKQETYYERINKDIDSLFLDDNNFEVIKNKVIKEGNSYKHIRDGKLIKTEFYKKHVESNTITLNDSIGNIKFVIKCENNKLKKVEKYSNQQIVFKARYGLIDISEHYKYLDKGYIISRKHNGNKTEYLVITDKISGEIISKSKILEEPIAGINQDLNGYYFVPEEDLSSKLYSEMKIYCQN